MKESAVALMFLCLTGTMALSPAAVAGQAPEDCVTCADAKFDECKHPLQNPEGYAHYAIDHGHQGQIHRRNEGTHFGYYCFSCSVKHPPTCQDGGNPNPPPLYEEDDIEQLQEAATTNDALGVLRIALRQPEGSPIRFNRERIAIQVRGCDERLVAVHIPLGHLPPQALAKALAAVDGSPLPAAAPAGEGETRR